MKTRYIKSLAILLSAGMLGGCGENAWNDHLDGFKEPPVYSAVETVSYTLTAKDYSTLAGLKANTAIAEAAGESAELKAIGTNACFSSQEEARKYLPAFLADSSFPYFTLNNGSSIKVTYALSSGVSEAVDAINSDCPLYRVSDAEYQSAWGSDEDFISGFAPVTPAASNLPKILLGAFPDAEEGDYVLASYYESAQNPVFTTVEGNDVPTTIEEDFASDQMSFTIDDIQLPGTSTYVWKRGSYGGVNYMQASGYVNKENLDSDSWLISPAVKIEDNATLSFQYIVNFFANVEKAMEEFTVGVRETGGSWTTVEIPNKPAKLGYDWIESGAIDLAAWKGKTIEIGFHYVSTTAKAGTLRVTDIKVLPTGTRSMTRAAAAEVPTVAKYALYRFNGNAWEMPANTLVLQPADYTAMGSTYGNLQDAQPQEYLPIYLRSALPYAKAEDQTTVVYRYYTGSSTVNRAELWDFNGQEWSRGNIATDQYTRNNNVWQFNPSVNLTLGKGEAISKLYYQTCVDWVFENIDVPLGSTSITSGVGYVTKYGNNEYYSGSSAYQTNVDLRPSAAVSQYPAGYEDMSDAEITELEKYRFCYEVFPGALAVLHQDARPVAGMDVLYTIDFLVYEPVDGGVKTNTYQMVYKVAGPGEFEFVSCNWWSDGKSPLE
ncbi:MAG: choice-of-anchor J domain-containing protein [Muribaculaceae bacterium]|nr:choice-of-anchor J domain-containing protein [Muribaculaceae bacterium]